MTPEGHELLVNMFLTSADLLVPHIKDLGSAHYALVREGCERVLQEDSASIVRKLSELRQQMIVLEVDLQQALVLGFDTILTRIGMLRRMLEDIEKQQLPKGLPSPPSHVPVILPQSSTPAILEPPIPTPPRLETPVMSFTVPLHRSVIHLPPMKSLPTIDTFEVTTTTPKTTTTTTTTMGVAIPEPKPPRKYYNCDTCKRRMKGPVPGSSSSAKFNENKPICHPCKLLPLRRARKERNRELREAINQAAAKLAAATNKSKFVHISPSASSASLSDGETVCFDPPSPRSDDP